ncbi:MAG: YraN family protein [Treponema sp. CETP13]|nr:MAG: YraN family protein [Treponema sp. CETP13]
MKKSKVSTKEKGDAGEDKAVEYLKKKGYEIITRNFRTRYGEIDIIAYKDNILVFVEVKTAPHGTLRTLEQILGVTKQKRIVETAKRFLLSYRQYSNSYIRFDVLVVDMPCYPNVYHIENAFSEFL